MSSPPTKRDQRRDTRRQQSLQRQEERRRARERARRQQQIRRIAITVGVIAIFGFLIWGAFALFSPHPTASAHPATGTQTQPANGQTIDNMACLTNEMLQVHYHTDVQIYINGQAQQIPAGIGIVENPNVPQQQQPHLGSNPNTSCLYYLHTHQATGMVHVEAPNNDTYTLGNLFDIWGKTLSPKEFMGNPVDGSHQLAIDVFDSNGKMTTSTGDPLQVKLAEHETIVIRYNSPNVQPKAFTLPPNVPDWGDL